MERIERHDDTKPQETKPAPGRPGSKPLWNTGHKQAVGTSLSNQSRVWFTIAHGYINEIYFPDVDKANTRFVRLLVSDGGGFLSDEDGDAEHEVRTAEPGIPAIQISTRCKSGKYRIEKEIITDPDRDALILQLRFEPAAAAGDLHLYVFANPHLRDEGEDNDGWSGKYKGVPMLFAQRAERSMAIGCSKPFKDLSCGYMGISDGLTQLQSRGRLSGTQTTAERGNVGLIGEIDWKSGPVCLAIGFGETSAEAGMQCRATLLRDFAEIRKQYVSGWRDFQGTLTDLSAQDGSLFRVSTAVSRIVESKRFPGAFVASLSIPWGFDRGDKSTGGYHVMWPRDLSETAMGLLATGDVQSARRALFYLQCTQEPDGHWNQNQWLDGTKNLTSRQMDETGYPLLLADLLRREGHISAQEPWSMIERTASHLVLSGPVTDEDRWEDLPGYCTFTMAVAIAALLAAADFTELNGEPGKAEFLRQTADAWNDMVDELTYASNTELARKHGVSGYYLRGAPREAITGKPLDNLQIDLRNHPEGQRMKRAVDVVSPDALALVRYGMRAADDPRMLDTIKVIDATLKTDTKTGPVWHRYTQDGYGEEKDGEPFNQHWGIGRGWPLLSAERAHYELARGNRKAAEALARSMEAQTTECGLIPEQVWDAQDIPEHNLYNGHPTGSGCPLAWAHAEYIQLLRSLRDGRVWSTPPQPVERYVKQKKTASFQIWTPKQKRGRLAHGKDLRIDLRKGGTVEWTLDCWKTSFREQTRDSGLGVQFVLLRGSEIPPGSKLRFRIRSEEGNGDEAEEFEISIG